MRKHALRTYLICVLVVIAVAVLMILSNHALVTGERTTNTCIVLQNVEKTEYVGEDTTVERYSFVLDTISPEISHLVFYTVHQNVIVYCDGQAVYSLVPDYKNAFNQSSGCIWVDIPLWESYNGKTIRIDLIPVYDSSLGRVPEFYVGTRYNIYMMIYSDYILQFIMSFLLIVIGIGYCIYISRYRNNEEVDKSPAYIGFFAILIGIWKLSDMASFRLAITDNPGAALLPFASIALLTVPAILFFRNMCRNKENRAWDLIILVCDIHIAAVILLQYMNIMDFRETFTVTLVVIVLAFVSTFIMMVRDMVKNGITKHIRLNLICEFMCGIAVALDMITYLWGGKSKTSYYAIFIFLGYVIITGVIAYKQAISLAKEGKETERYENQAYHDQLTGLFNRTALEKDVEEVMNATEHIIVVNFDLNDLKQCNDVLGHEKGDTYIKDSASIIAECFGELGNCYRSGGDEFHCLVVKSNLNECKKAIEALRTKCYQYNHSGTDICMSIAVGYAAFDKRIDYNFADTMKRADKMMYQNKAELKQMKGQNPIG